MLALFVQIFLAVATALCLRGALSTSVSSDFLLMTSLFTMVLAVAHGFSSLPGMAKAAFGSIPYRVAFILITAPVAVVSTVFFVIFLFAAIPLIPRGFFVGTWFARFSLTAGLDNLIGTAVSLFVFAAYAYIWGTLSILMLFRTEEQALKHWILKGLDQSPGGFEFPDDAFPYTPPPMPPTRNAAAPRRPPPPPPKPPDRAPCGCPFAEARFEDLEKTELRSRSVYPGPWRDPKTTGRQGQFRRCPSCSSLWWMDVHEWTYESINDRSPEPEPPVTTHHCQAKTGIRVRDAAHAEALSAWAPELWKAYEHWDGVRPRGLTPKDSVNAAELRAAVEALAAVVARHPEAQVILPPDAREALRPPPR